MKRLVSFVLLTLFLTACAAPFGNTWEIFPTQTNPIFNSARDLPTVTPQTFDLATPPADATPTLTPFQPLLPTLTLTGTLTPAPVFDPNLILPGESITPSFFVPTYAPHPASILTDGETATFLLLGSDKRPGQTYFRTDTLVIVAVRPTIGQVTLISIPRDLWVYIPTVGMNRINAAYEYGEMYHYPGGGEALVEDTVLYNLGVRIDHFAIIDFDGFRNIVDTLGGLDVPVFCPYTDWRLIDPGYDPSDEDNWELYTVGPGVVYMDGDLALWYVRSRKKSNDFDRGRRSQEVLRALYASALQIDILGKIPQLYEDFSSSIITDLSLTDLLQLAPLAFHLNTTDIRSYYLGRDVVTSWTTPGGASVLIPNEPAIQALLEQALSPHPEERSEYVVEVRNGTDNSGWDSLAAERLTYAGYATRLAPADRQDYADSLLYDLSASPDLDRGTSLLSLLGLPPSAFVTAPAETDIDYALVVGEDYQPCFNPSALTP